MGKNYWGVLFGLLIFFDMFSSCKRVPDTSAQDQQCAAYHMEIYKEKPPEKLWMSGVV